MFCAISGGFSSVSEGVYPGVGKAECIFPAKPQHTRKHFAAVFAAAKRPANAEYENEYEYEIEIDYKKRIEGVQGEEGEMRDP